jgi:hypothetical protein
MPPRALLCPVKTSVIHETSQHKVYLRPKRCDLFTPSHSLYNIPFSLPTFTAYLRESPTMVTANPANPEMKLDPKYDDYDYPTTAPTPQPGHPGHTTPEQDAQVFQLRSMLEAAGCTERLDTLSMVRFIPVDFDSKSR